LPTLMPDPGVSVAYDRAAWDQVTADLSPSSVPGLASLRSVLAGAGDGLGSNCWALAGAKTKSGKPLLAGDPHLPVRNPSIWYEIGLSAADLSLIGFSIPGVPGVVIGHNDHIAWSFTYALADTEDLFVEHQDPTDLRRFEFQGRFEPATFVRETIKIKGKAEPFLLAGWTGANEWRGLLPADANPFVLDPTDGVILSANNRPVKSATDAGYMGEWDPGFRYAYLRSVLDQTRGADVVAMSRLQNDYTSLPVQRYRDAIVASRPTTALGQQLQGIVQKWDGSLGVDSTGAAIYEAWLGQMSRLVFADKLGPALYDDYASNGRMTFALYQLIASTTSHWFVELGDPGVTGRDAIAGAALDAAGKDLVAKLGADVGKWRWGDLHTVAFEHPLSAAKPLDLIFTIGPVRRAGDGYSPNNGAYSLLRPFSVRSHASERQIVDLADVDASVSIIPTGQSGQPFSRHWGDQMQLWANGQTKPMALARD